MAAFSHFFDPRRIRNSKLTRWFPWKVVKNRRGSDEVSKPNSDRTPKPNGNSSDKAAKPGRKPKIGIAFSSGGAKGLAHIGVIQVLEENGFEVSAIAGTSMGAYVGALWSSGIPGPELEKLAASMASSKDRWKLVDPVFPPRRGFIAGKKIEERLRSSLANKTFAQLNVPTYLVATEMESFARHVFHEGDVASAIVASLAVPGIVHPVKRGSREFVDGGIAAPLPVSVLREYADVDKVIAVSVIPSIKELKRATEASEKAARKKIPFWKRPFKWLNRHLNYFAHGNLLDILRASAMGSQMRLVEKSAAEADVFIRAVNPTGQWHDYHNYKIYVELGRKAAEAALPKLRELFETEIDSDPDTPSDKAEAILRTELPLDDSELALTS
ncbi:MAG: hypothetical protein HKN23_13985 [Verrucomicrobiales bacterium]|nr:hypothetical protein [Verrucomicrobiales bacterium]